MRPRWQGGDKSHFSFPLSLCLEGVPAAWWFLHGFCDQRAERFSSSKNSWPFCPRCQQPGCVSIFHRPLVQQELHWDLQTCALGVSWWPKLPPSFSRVFKSDWDINNKNQSVIKVCTNRKLLLFFSKSKRLICSAFQENYSSFIRKIRASITHFYHQKTQRNFCNYAAQ